MTQLIASFHSHGAEETVRWGKEFGKGLTEGTILAFSGDLGSGKTTLIKGIVSGILEDINPEQVTSPTFIYFTVYQSRLGKSVCHFDLYRLKDHFSFLEAGFEEYLFGKGVVCIEWSERISSILPPHTLHISLQPLSEKERLIQVWNKNEVT